MDSSDPNNTVHHYVDHNSTDEECKLRHIDDINTEIADEFINIGYNSEIGVIVEVALLCLVIFNSMVLSILLMQTKDKLSTATILFIFNILFSNALFVASFGCMFSDFYEDLPYDNLNEEQISQSTAAFIIAETLQTHLFAPSEFFKHLVQETLFSLAQNGSLLGLTHLLVLVLVVINKSMSGKAIKLSKKCVILVFAFVWAFLIGTHIVFSALQFSAITHLDHMFSQLNSNPGSLNCGKPITSDYREIGQKCDRVAVFHTFGVYLLRGHTLFTLIFLVTSILVYAVTSLYHLKVRAQHDFLNGNRSFRDHNPHRRRETLFNTLLLSIGAFFISVLGQSFVEIAVFWVDDRHGVANLAKYYQLARIVSFLDPLLNPVLVSVRTPTIRRRLRYYLYVTLGIISFIFCPWRMWRQRHRRTGSSSQRKRSSTKTPRRASSTTATIDSVSRLESSDSEVTLKLFCTTRKLRSSLTRKSKNSTANSNSVI
ncbi:hypothetical protein FO519_001071 [Halicephalobus sp. NKZ332]|nr:hypothetical protein FO519_001071 [Halicephalobus sp. NKZ332]